MQADAGRHEEAFQTFTAVIASHSTDPRGWAGLAGAHFFRGGYTECLECLHKARELATTLFSEDAADRLPELAHNIASVQFVVGAVDDAWRTIRALPPEQQRLPAIRAMSGKLLLRASRYGDAIADLEAAWAVRPEASAALAIDLADCYRALGHQKKESQVLDNAIEQFPRVPELYKRSADSHLANGRTSAAIEAMRQASKHSPECRSESPEYRAQLAALLYRVGRAQEARVEAGRCIEQAALTKRDRYYRGLAYHLVGQSAAATYELHESRSDPLVKGWPDYRTLLSG
jgi:tetratricopeptide (TPR) repeat protein